MLSKVRSFLRLRREDRPVFVAAYGMLGLARLALLLVPFRHIGRRLGGPTDGAAARADGAQMEEARRIGRLVEMAARHTLWQSACLAQAMTAKAFLEWRRIPSTLYFGVALRPDRTLEAHAWVTCGSVYVTGGEGISRFQVISTHGPSRRTKALSSGGLDREGAAVPPQPEERP